MVLNAEAVSQRCFVNKVVLQILEMDEQRMSKWIAAFIFRVKLDPRAFYLNMV